MAKHKTVAHLPAPAVPPPSAPRLVAQLLVEQIAMAAGKAGAREALMLMGVDPDRPRDMQADLAHLRRWRVLSERSVGWAATTIVGRWTLASNWIASMRH